jgi:hypothetical protein
LGFEVGDVVVLEILELELDGAKVKLNSWWGEEINSSPTSSS